MFGIAFCMNPTSWSRKWRLPWPGGMADALARPITKHLESPWAFTDAPLPGYVNCYYAHRSRYGAGRGVARERSVFISHGIADKGWRPGKRLKGRFDWVFVSGPAWSDRTFRTGYPETRLVEVGYAKLDPIFNGEIPKPKRDGRIRVVWAPTHGGGGEPRRGQDAAPGEPWARNTTWGRAQQVLRLLPESEFDVVIAPHPRHRPDRRSTLAEYVGADVVIADGGSTIYEAWALDLPVVFPDWLVAAANVRRGDGKTFEADIYRNGIGWHVEYPDRLAYTVERAAALGITANEQEFIEPIFPRRYRGRSGRMHAEALDDIFSRREVRHVAKFRRIKFHRASDNSTIEVIPGSPQERRFRRFRSDWVEVE